VLERPDHKLIQKTRVREIRILALDDDPFIRKILEGIFREFYRFKAAASVTEFHQTVKSFDPDIVLIDVILPDGNGIDVCRWLREQARYEQLFILMLTSFEDIESIEAAYRAGANDYIRKPFIPFEISSKIHHISRTINYQNSVIRLYNHQKTSSRRLYLLADLINRHINTTDKQTLIDSVFEVASFTRCDYCELLRFGETGNERKIRRYDDNFAEISFTALSQYLKLMRDESLQFEGVKIGRGAGSAIYCYIGKLYYNKRPEGFFIMQSHRPFHKEVRDLLSLYFDFVNILGVDLNAKTIMRAEIHKERKEIAKVRSLQVSLLPHFEEVDKYDIASTFIPMEEISGDFFDGFYSAEGIYQIILCDVSGHGVASSFIGSSIRGLLRAVDYDKKSPAKIIYDLNELVVKNFSSIYYFSSLIFCTLNVLTGEVILVSAGHPPCFYYNNARREYERIENTGPLVGLIKGASYEERHLTLNPGDCLFLYTDGIIEAPSERGGDMFGEDRLFKLFQDQIEYNSIDMIHSVVGNVYEHTGFSSLHDDATVICIKRKN
jgi:CheY-like chemotaxis protein